MKKYIKTYIFLIILCTIAFNGWSQSDSIRNNGELIPQSKVKIAYGEQEKNNISSSISTVKGEELLKGSISNFGNTLFGKFPGLYVSQGSGEPGNDSPTLRLRGASAAPMVIIDGFERDMTYISPEEIEEVSVLKDASAVALYGMKGANGVILITSKRGKVQKGKIEVSLQSGIQTPVNTMEVLNATKYMNLYNRAALNDGLSAKYSESDILAAGSSPLYPNVNWQDLVIKDFTNISKANVSFIGGTNFIKYFVGVGGLYNDGIYKPTNPDFNANANLSRLNIRSNIDINVSKSSTFSMDLAGSINRNLLPADKSSKLWTSILTLPPNEFNSVNPDGSYGGSSLHYDNPLAMLEMSGRNITMNHFLNASFRFNQKLDLITEGLSASIGYIVDNGAENADGKWRYFRIKQIANKIGENYGYDSFREDGSYTIWNNANSARNTTFESDITYNMPEKNGNKLDVFVRFQRDQAYRTNSDLFPYLTNNIGGRIHYAKDNTYLLEVAASYFGSDQYADGNQYGFFPSASVGWVFTNEAFANDSKLFTYGKLKASYGITGNNRYENGRYPFAQYYENGGNFPLGTDWAWFYGISPAMLANEDIGWEISKKMNIGVELELVDKLTVEADYYINKSTDVLYIDYTNPSISGANLPYENIGKLTDSGVDVKLGYNSGSGEFEWFTDLVFSYYKNTVDEMGESLHSGGLEHLNKTGNPVNAIFGYQTDGYFESESDISSSPKQTFGTPRVGDLKYVDQNNDNIIDSRDKTVIGNSKANIDLGLRLGFKYKNFDAEAMIQGQFNHDINLDGNTMAQPFISGNAANEIVEEDGFPALTLSNMNNYQNSTYWVRNGDFLKLRNLELGYTLSEGALSSLNMKNVRFFVRGVNVLTVSKWKFTDPEYTAIGYPPMKSYLLGVNINF